MVRVATLAPSLLNTQPWGFAIRGDQIEIRADDGRWVPSIDPSKRLMILSCGAALLNLRLAMSHAAWTPLVEAFPDDDDPGLVARVRRGSARAISDQDELLLNATERRRTNRRPFSGQPIPPATLSQVVAATETEDAEGVLVTGMDAIELRGIFKLAEREAGADQDVAAALSQWIRETSGHDDGLTLDVLGPVPRGTASARDFLHGEHREERGDSDFEADSTLLVIATSGAHPRRLAHCRAGAGAGPTRRDGARRGLVLHRAAVRERRSSHGGGTSDGCAGCAADDPASWIRAPSHRRRRGAQCATSASESTGSALQPRSL